MKKLFVLGLLWLVSLMCLGFFLQASEGPSEQLIVALIQVESKGDDSARGDLGMSQTAFGCLQIRQPCIADALGSDRRAEECLGDRALSVEVCKKYLARYATAKRLGHEPTNEDMARIWNGGPGGWKKKSTEKYWKEVKKFL